MSPLTKTLSKQFVHSVLAIFVFIFAIGLLYPAGSMIAYASNSSTEQSLPRTVGQNGAASLSDAVTLDGSGAIYSISGTVLYNGSGLENVTVTATSDTATFTAVTAADGTYIITDLPAGSYDVVPSLSGYAFSPGSIPVLIDTESVSSINFAALMTKTISGKIIANNIGLPGVVVTAKSLTATYTGTTGADGVYTITVVPGVYNLKPTKVGYIFRPAAVIITVTTANVTKNFLAVGNKSITGKITVNKVGLAGVKVYYGISLSVTTGADGSYTISSLPAGVYILTPMKIGYSFAPKARVVVLTTPSPNPVVNFIGKSVSCFRLVKTALPTGQLGGTVTADPTNSPECPANSYLAGTTITLTATPASDFKFVRWNAGINSTTNPYTYTMPARPSIVNALFRFSLFGR